MYKKVEYIESTGTQYIDTELIGTSGLSFEMGLQFLGDTIADVYVMGSRTTSNRIYALHVYKSMFCIGYGRLELSSHSSDNLYHDFKTILNEREQGFWVDGVRYYTGTNSDLINTNLPIYLFACNNSGSAYCSKQRIYYVKIYKDNELVRDFVPMLDTDTGKAGLYDNVNDKFYTSNGEDFNYHIKYTYLYLVRDGSTLYTVKDGTLSVIEGNITADLFIKNGVDAIPDGALLITLSNPEVLCWTNGEDSPTLTATVTGTPQPQTIISDKIYLTDKSITGIESALATCDGDLVVAVSFDDKQTWKAHNGTEWVTLSDEFAGMNKDTLEAITFEQWNELYNGTGFYVRISLTDTTQAVEKIVFDFSN